MAPLANRLKIRIVDWPRQEEVEGIVVLIVVKDALKCCLNFGTTESCVFSPRYSVGQCKEDCSSDYAG